MRFSTPAWCLCRKALSASSPIYTKNMILARSTRHALQHTVGVLDRIYVSIVAFNHVDGGSHLLGKEIHVHAFLQSGAWRRHLHLSSNSTFPIGEGGRETSHHPARCYGLC